MGVSISEQNYKNYGKCVFLENGSVKLGVTVDVGPRVIYFSLNGRENVMFEDVERRFSEDVGEYGKWISYGGHRLWCAPEFVPETYSPDSAPVNYDFDGKKLLVSPPVTPFGKKFEIEIVMDDEKPVVSLTHRITNVSDHAAEYAAWSITSMTTGGVCYVPVSTKKTGFLPNRVMSMWDYTDIFDSRLTLSNTVVQIAQDESKENAFKLGFNVEDGFILHAVKDQVFAKCVSEYEFVKYPDYSCNVEVYTNSKFLECEVIGEMKEFAPGEAAEISERWCIFDDEKGGSHDADQLISDMKKKITDLLQ